MKTVGAIRNKIKQVRFRYLKKRLEEELAPSSQNCHFNVAVPVTGSEPVYICMYGANDLTKWEPTICDSSQDTRARNCSLFCPRNTKEQIQQTFQKELDSSSLPQIAYLYPDLAALIWVLDAEDVPAPEDPVTEESAKQTPIVADLDDKTSTAITVSAPRTWWARLLGGVFS